MVGPHRRQLLLSPFCLGLRRQSSVHRKTIQSLIPIKLVPTWRVQPSDARIFRTGMFTSEAASMNLWHFRTNDYRAQHRVLPESLKDEADASKRRPLPLLAEEEAAAKLLAEDDKDN
jgi:hypothetical protein